MIGKSDAIRKITKELRLTCYLGCDGCVLRILYVYDHDTREVLQSPRRVVWGRGIETLVFLEPSMRVRVIVVRDVVLVLL
jgi:hypothetical protein